MTVWSISEVLFGSRGAPLPLRRERTMTFSRTARNDVMRDARVKERTWVSVWPKLGSKTRGISLISCSNLVARPSTLDWQRSSGKDLTRDLSRELWAIIFGAKGMAIAARTRAQHGMKSSLV